MSKIANGGLTRSGIGCFIAEPILQQWASKGFNVLSKWSHSRPRFEESDRCMNKFETQIAKTIRQQNPPRGNLKTRHSPEASHYCWSEQRNTDKSGQNHDNIASQLGVV